MQEEIDAAWVAAGPKPCLGTVSKALKSVMSSLQQWSREKFRSVQKELEQLRQKLEELQNSGGQSDLAEIKVTMDRMK